MSVPQPDASLEPIAAPPSASSSSGPSGLESASPTAPPPESGVSNTADPANKVLAGGKTPQSWLWLTKLDQTFVTVFVAVFLVLVGYHWATLGGWGMQPIEVDRLPERQYDFRIDINSASWVEWTQIEGIGEATANKIIADRDTNGAFKSIDDLLRVKGIGPKTLEKMRPFLREPNETSASAKVTP